LSNVQKEKRLVCRGAWPVCSHRCQLIDLGKWLGGGHVISEPLRPEHFEKYAGLPPGEHLNLPEKE